MKNTKIDWCDSAWNPVTGCKHGCEYYYAKGIAKRFSGWSIPKGNVLHKPLDGDSVVLDNPLLILRKNGKWYKSVYPYDFIPTFYRYRLDVEKEVGKKPQTVFVCSMADLFGEWVPDKWIEEVFAACAKAPQHRYLFLTKNPERYVKLMNAGKLPQGNNYWYGTTLTSTKEYPRASDIFALSPLGYNVFFSIEPILDRVLFKMLPDWVIIGAETGNRKEKVEPLKPWIDYIAAVCYNSGAKIFMKDSLRGIIPDDEFRQEYPWKH